MSRILAGIPDVSLDRKKSVAPALFLAMPVDDGFIRFVQLILFPRADCGGLIFI